MKNWNYVQPGQPTVAFYWPKRATHIQNLKTPLHKINQLQRLRDPVTWETTTQQQRYIGLFKIVLFQV